MTKNINSENDLAPYRDAFPEYSDEELHEVRETLREYLQIVIGIATSKSARNQVPTDPD